MATNEDILTPSALVIPALSQVGAMPTTPPKGTIVLSGAKLYFYTGSAWATITSA